ncbi:MAG TPA: hypothetical protein VGS28_00445, partial [Candidatus Saccharimonadales bacterium]|nr:hypothetical protein [Candidatus Saccharimonadales bacterium]
DVYHSGTTIGGLTTNAATISQSATSASIGFYLDDQRPNYTGLVEDEYGSGSKSQATTFTSAVGSNFATNFNNEVILLFAIISQGAATISSVSGGGFTWVNVGRANTNSGSVELWRTFAPTPTNFFPTVNYSVGVKSVNNLLIGFVGADITGTNGSGAIGAFSTGSSTNAAPTISVTTTRNNSWVYGAVNDPVANSTNTPGTGQGVIRSVGDSTNVCKSWVQRQSAITTTSGTNVTINDTAPTTDSCNILAVEILPAVRHNLAATGVG